MHVLFVCTGNTCRSPMAEGLFRRLAREAGLRAKVKSAGVSAFSGSPFAKHAKTVLHEREADFEGASTSVTPELLQWADYIFVMTMGHKRALLSRAPEHIDKVHLLKEYIHQDPQIEEYRSTLDKLYVEAEMKRAQFMTENKQQLEQLERRLSENEGKDSEHEQALQHLQERLRELTREEEEQIRQLEMALPDYDIADPVGGTLDDYRRCADELESSLRQLVQQLKEHG